MTEIIIDLDAYTKPELSGYREPPIAAHVVRLRALVSQLLELGFTKFLSPPDPRILNILSQLRRRYPFEVVPLLVDAGRHSREMQTYGLIGFARRRLFAAGPVGGMRTSLEALPRVVSILRRDYVDGSLFLAALELTEFARFLPRRALLHPNSADLATANRNHRLFQGFASMLRKRGVAPGIMTNNAGWLVPLLDEWGLAMTVATPVTASGYHMKPTREACIVSARHSRCDFIAVLPARGRIEDADDLPASAVIASPADAVAGLTLLDSAAR